MNKLVFLLSIIFFTTSLVKAQTINEMLNEHKPIHDKEISLLSRIEIEEDSLVHIADSMYSAQTEEEKVLANYAFIKKMKTALKLPNSYKHTFTKLGNKLSLQNSPDNLFKLFTWEIVPNENNIRYYGVIQMMDGKLFPLIDVSSEIIRNAQDTILSDMKWYGALYYNIIRQEVEGVPVYFLLGWNGASLNSEKKLIDVFTFDKTMKPVFGAPVFNSIERGKRKQVNRFIIEYQKGSRVSLNKDNEMIIVDHCESQIGDPAKKYTYLPDGTYDGFIWSNNQWNMSENVVQVVEQKDAPMEVPNK
jgi:hypothetical protein